MSAHLKLCIERLEESLKTVDSYGWQKLDEWEFSYINDLIKDARALLEEVRNDRPA